MDKNILVVLNSVDKHWVHIVNLKCSNLNVWDRLDHKHVPWFYKMLCKIAKEMGPHLWIKCCNSR